MHGSSLHSWLEKMTPAHLVCRLCTCLYADGAGKTEVRVQERQEEHRGKFEV